MCGSNRQFTSQHCPTTSGRFRHVRRMHSEELVVGAHDLKARLWQKPQHHGLEQWGGYMFARESWVVGLVEMGSRSREGESQPSCPPL